MNIPYSRSVCSACMLMCQEGRTHRFRVSLPSQSSHRGAIIASVWIQKEGGCSGICLLLSPNLSLCPCLSVSVSISVSPSLSLCLSLSIYISIYLSSHFSFFFSFFVFLPFLTAYGVSQARGLISAIATSLCQSHSKVGSEPHLQPTPQLMATPDPLTH